MAEEDLYDKIEQRAKIVYEKGKVVTDAQQERKKKSLEGKMFKNAIRDICSRPSALDPNITVAEEMALSVVARQIETGDVKGFVELSKLNGDYQEEVNVTVNKFDEYIKSLNKDNER